MNKSKLSEKKNNLLKYLVNNGGQNGKTWEELSVMFRIPTSEIARHTWRRYKNSGKNAQKTSKKDNYISNLEDTVFQLTEDLNKGTAEKTFDSKEEIKTLEDLIRIGKIDTSVWKIDRYVQNFWANKWQVKAFMSVRTKSKDIGLMKEQLINEIKKHSIVVPELPNAKSKSSVKKDCMLELAIFDPHFGKLSWDKETGEDYDLDIAVKRYKEAIYDLLLRCNADTIEKIVLPIGNDMMNIDGKFNATTSGTPQDSDSRFGKIFQTVRKVLIEVIDTLSYIAPVDVVVVPGNHDEHTMFTLGEVMEAWYHNNKNVNVFNSPKLRKYVEYGDNMIMFTHGDKEKQSNLGMIAATEEPAMWGRTKFREVHLGHFHKSKTLEYITVDEHQGFKIRIIPSLSGTDAWHYSKGYLSQKSAQAFIWHKTRGLITNHFFNV